MTAKQLVFWLDNIMDNMSILMNLIPKSIYSKYDIFKVLDSARHDIYSATADIKAQTGIKSSYEKIDELDDELADAIEMIRELQEELKGKEVAM